MFLTTHSSIAIDIFSNEINSQIIHVIHENGKSSTQQSFNYSDYQNILDDMDFRASDIFQSNCIVWLEGPTDRVYFNKWIELWTNGSIVEGSHYQCAFYGGKILSHHSVNQESSDLKFVNMLKINRHCILIMDSDKKNIEDTLNYTKERIIQEINDIDGIVWVTKGNEIENYIPVKTLQFYQKDLDEIMQFQKFSDYSKLMKEKKIDINFDKVQFANEIKNYLTKDDIEEWYDLKEKLDLICKQIKTWNKG